MYTSSLEDWYKKRNKPNIKFDYNHIILDEESDYITVWIDGGIFLYKKINIMLQ